MLALQLIEVCQDDVALRTDRELLVAETALELSVAAVGPEFCCRSVFKMRWETADLKCIQHRYEQTVKQRAEQSRTYRLHVAEK